MRSLLSFLLVSLFAFSGKAKPNFVVVLVDDHAFEAISAYETYLQDFAKTPAIDRLAAEGMRFDNFTCANSICSPSRASILTGQYSHKNGVTGLNGSINDDSPQYPEELNKAGYPNLVGGQVAPQEPAHEYDKHMVVKGQGKYFDPVFNGSEGTWERTGYSTGVYTDIAMDWLEKRDENKPFLLCLNSSSLITTTVMPPASTTCWRMLPLPSLLLFMKTRGSNSNLKKEFLRRTKFHMLHSGATRTSKPRAMPTIAT